MSIPTAQQWRGTSGSWAILSDPTDSRKLFNTNTQEFEIPERCTIKTRTFACGCRKYLEDRIIRCQKYVDWREDKVSFFDHRQGKCGQDIKCYAYANEYKDGEDRRQSLNCGDDGVSCPCAEIEPEKDRPCSHEKQRAKFQKISDDETARIIRRKKQQKRKKQESRKKGEASGGDAGAGASGAVAAG
ncbi:uncharacterized protein BDZ99DRAFT_481485 [Mytilinidion resinicola]|uniref:Uncharacterized protein n=1 Tax=Mytilinidion resinicola TaxID=574789 RepID=A0A6A6Y749_9PEZI|nr:uncharacterized protein BDZ99DRAFT_481485 [Mytilinidion resinicola]KAF2804353.1 hypothetical protein BDZ99DRAFT_481485 [Mytilinidion resinicola]